MLTPDSRLLFATRSMRLFAYGFLSVVLVLYLGEAGLNEAQIGRLLTFTLVGDTVISLWLSQRADRLGRRRMLLIGALLMIMAGAVFALTRNPILLLLAAIVGVISPSGGEVGPFLSIEQAALSHVVEGKDRTRVFAWFNLAGTFATALGSLAGGFLAQESGNRAVVLGYAALGGVLALLFTRLSAAAELKPGDAPLAPSLLGLHQSRAKVLRLSILFAMDSFGGGFVLQALVCGWLHVRFGADAKTLGMIFFGANLLAACSSLAAASLAARIGLINTMVFTHVPSNLLLIAVPFMPSLPWAVAVLLARFSISQMDVPTRQSYTMAVVAPDERSAAAGVTGVARTMGQSVSPALAGKLYAMGGVLGGGLPFVVGGSVKILYDLALYAGFRAHKPPEEAPR